MNYIVLYNDVFMPQHEHLCRSTI